MVEIKGIFKKAAILSVAVLIMLMPVMGYAEDLPLTLPGEDDSPTDTQPAVRRATVLCNTNYRALPGETAETVGEAHIGETLEVYAVNVNGQWDAVMDGEGRMVYIHSSAVSITAPTYSKDDHSDIHVTDGGVNGYPGEVYNDKDYLALMAEATKYIGFPYVFGGSTPETSFDCSGYVCWVLNHSGFYKTERTDAQGLYNLSTEISKEEARPGDLIFFQGTYETPNTVTHVAIYVGNGYMLHAGKPIGYSRMETDYWQSHFYAFGRLGQD